MTIVEKVLLSSFMCFSFSFKVDSSTLYKAFHALQMAAQRSGSYGVNQCVSNTIVGISAATGQDLTSVHESSWAEFDVTVERNIKVAGERL